MSEEVKEILDRLNNIPMGELYACCLEDSECKIILDYITNLQEKYEEADNDRHKLFEQKEKAIEFIKEEAGYDEEIRSCCSDLLYSDCDKLIELLSGDE